MYRTVVLEYAPKAEDMARQVEARANEMEAEGYVLAAFSVTGAGKAILVFHK